MSRKIGLAALALLAMMAMSSPAFATDTNIAVRVKAKDALFIGSGAGAYIIVRDKNNGDVIAEGAVTGTTGSRDKIMNDGFARDAALTDDKTAKIEFSLDLPMPLPVTIEAYAPSIQEQAKAVAKIDYLLIPGKDYTAGNGIVIEIPGFAVDILEPAFNRKGKFSADGTTPVEVNVAKLCGCAIDKDSPWPPERYDVEVHLFRDNIYLVSVKMDKMPEPGLYGAKVRFQEPGTYQIMVTAFDPKTLEGGIDRTSIVLEP